MGKRKGKVYIGTSGWYYKHWVGEFYPEGAKPESFFKHYSSIFSTVELNNTFYHLPRSENFTSWKSASPEKFLFAVKASRYITHQKKLKDSSEALALFLSKADLLGSKLGPILFQLPPSLKMDVKRLESFLQILPKGHRYIFEFRNETWFSQPVFELMKEYNVCLCIYELAGYRSPEVVTADFVYIRLHGPGNKYQGLYHGNSINAWARKIKAWRGKSYDVFCYFDNDQKGYAAKNAIQLIHRISG